ncbi:hypothetical protein CHUAL_012144 [Chamberlinius hualienensis]
MNALYEYYGQRGGLQPYMYIRKSICPCPTFAEATNLTTSTESTNLTTSTESTNLTSPTESTMAPASSEPNVTTPTKPSTKVPSEPNVTPTKPTTKVPSTPSVTTPTKPSTQTPSEGRNESIAVVSTGTTTSTSIGPKETTTTVDDKKTEITKPQLRVNILSTFSTSSMIIQPKILEQPFPNQTRNTVIGVKQSGRGIAKNEPRVAMDGKTGNNIVNEIKEIIKEGNKIVKQGNAIMRKIIHIPALSSFNVPAPCYPHSPSSLSFSNPQAPAFSY